MELAYKEQAAVLFEQQKVYRDNLAAVTAAKILTYPCVRVIDQPRTHLLLLGDDYAPPQVSVYHLADSTNPGWLELMDASELRPCGCEDCQLPNDDDLFLTIVAVLSVPEESI